MNSKIIRRVAIGAALMSGLPLAAFAQATATSTTSATTTIVQPISIANGAPLAFGSIVKSAVASTTNTVTINATSGVRSIAGAGTGALAGTTGSRATYTATGEGAQTFTISAPNFSMASGGNNLAVTTTTTAATGTLSGAIGATGTFAFGVGGSFPVTDTTVSGVYTGSLAVTVAYN